MASTTFAHANAHTQEVWAPKLFKYALKNMWLSKFMGTSSESIIQINKDLTKSKGDMVTFGLRSPLAGTGQGDDGYMQGNGEALQFLYEQVQVHELAHSVEGPGRLSDQRTQFNFRTNAVEALGDWKAQNMDDNLVAALSGLYNKSTSIDVVNEVSPSTNRIWYGGETSAGVVKAATTQTTAGLSTETATDVLMGPNVISTIKRLAMTATPKLRPIRYMGRDVYVCLMHPLQVKALRANTDWQNSKYYADVRGEKNPLFSGALFMWDGVVIHEYDRIALRTGAGGTTPSEGFALNTARTATTDAVASGKSHARALFLGAQAGVVAYAKMPTWLEYYDDAPPRHPAIGTDMLLGIKKTQFKNAADTAQEDFGTYVIETQVQTD